MCITTIRTKSCHYNDQDLKSDRVNSRLHVYTYSNNNLIKLSAQMKSDGVHVMYIDAVSLDDFSNR